MVGRTGPTFRPVVEEQSALEAVGQFVERGIGVEDRLGAVAPGGDREMGREDGEGIDEHVEVLAEGPFLLNLRTMVLAEEAGALGQRLLIDLGPRAHHASGVVLGTDRTEVSHLHACQVGVACGRLRPCGHLIVEKLGERHAWWSLLRLMRARSSMVRSRSLYKLLALVFSMLSPWSLLPVQRRQR